MRRIAMRNMKFPFLQSLFSLIFIFCFCAILLFAITDYSGIDEKLTTEKISIFNWGFDYWSWFSAMLCSGVASIITMFLKKDNEWNKIDRALYIAVAGLFAFIIVLSFGFRLSKYLNVENTPIDPWLFGLDILAILLFFGFAFLSTKRIETGDMKYSKIALGIFAACLACAFGVSNHYMPRGVMNQLNQDYKTIRKVNQLEFDILDGKDFGKLPDGISVREENGKKIISWNMITDFENLDKKIKITKRLKFKFGGDILIPGMNPKHKKGKNERVVGSDEALNALHQIKKKG